MKKKCNSCKEISVFKYIGKETIANKLLFFYNCENCKTTCVEKERK